MHGRGWILRVAQVLLRRKPVLFDLGHGAFVEGQLDDWMTLWAFMCRHEADAPFQHSLELLKPEDVALDIGANFGIWSLLAATRITDGRIHAFEPVPDTARRLRDHVELNDARAIEIHQLALGAEKGSMPFFATTSGNSGASALVRRRAEDVEIRVEVVTLDDWIEREKIERIDLMKVDVEGAEMLVFRGARRLLSSESAPILFFEIDDDLCADFGTTARDVKQLLIDYGYAIYRWHEAGARVVSLDERQPHEDLFALKPGQPAHVRM